MLLVALYSGGFLLQLMVDTGHVNVTVPVSVFCGIFHEWLKNIGVYRIAFCDCRGYCIQGSISDTDGKDEERNFTYSNLEPMVRLDMKIPSGRRC